MLCKVPNFLGKSTIEHKTNNFALAVKRACVASVSVRFRSKERGTRVSQRPREKMAQVKEQGGGGEETPLPSFIFCLSFHFSRGQNRKSSSSVLFCSDTKRKRLLRRLAVKWPIGSANTLLSHGPGNEETSRKWESSSGTLEVGKPPNHCGRHLRRKLRIARNCDCVFTQIEPQETLNSLFSYLGSSVKDT